MNVMVFDIETVPDVAAGRRLYDLDGLNDKDIAEVMFTRRREQTEGRSEFLAHHLHRIVAIAVTLCQDNEFRVWSLGDIDAEEKELVTRFFDGIDRNSPTLVSWNGGGFDLPVLHYRALMHGVAGARYWEDGEEDRDFKWNNYLNRFHSRHTDLMDVLAGYQPRANAGLDAVATLLGLPGKLGLHGSEVWNQYRTGKLAEIRSYCETDVLNTFLVYLRWQLIRGRLSAKQWQQECDRVRQVLVNSGKPHLEQFARH